MSNQSITQILENKEINDLTFPKQWIQASFELEEKQLT